MMTMHVGTGNGSLATSTAAAPTNGNSLHTVTLPLQPPPVQSHSQHFDKYLSCGFWHGRTCLERIIFTLLVILLVGVFLVAALLFLHIGSGGLKRLSGLMFADSSSHVSGNNNVGGIVIDSGLAPHAHPELVDLIDDGIDIVRIKTTEEHKLKGSLKSKPIVRTKRVCVSGECSALSRRILQNIDPEQDPCTSFYSFSCGGWMARNPPPPRRMVHSVMSQMRDKIDHKLKDLIERIDKDRSDKVNIQLKTFYDSCMDVDSIRTKGFIPAVDFIHHNFSDFLKTATKMSMFERTTDSTDELTRLLLELLKVNGSPLLDISLDLAPRNSSRYIGVVRVPNRAAILPRLVRSGKETAAFRRWFRERRKRNSHQPHKLVPRKEIFRNFQNALNAQRVAGLVKTAETMGILDTSTEATKQSDIDEILGFLAALEKVLPSEKEMKQNLMNNAIYNEYNVEELETSFRYINWNMLLGGLFPQKPKPHDIMLVHDPKYLRKLGRIITLFGKRVVWKSLLVLYAKNVLTDLVTIHHGQPRWQYCTLVSSTLFGEALSRLFLSSIPAVARRAMAKEVGVIFHLMKKHVLKKMDEVQWITKSMKDAAESKVNKLSGSFLGSDIFFNYTFLQDRYGRVDITDDFFSNVLKMFAHFRRNIYHFVNAPVDRDMYTWNLISYPFTVNAFHLQQLNNIVIPLGLMQDAHYTQNVPKYLNVGSLGFTLAHEILHSIDLMGRGFDADGTLRDWSDAVTRKNYDNVTQCVINQYQEHFRRPLRIDSRSIMIEVDGKFTLNENVCDIDGMKVAASAFSDLREASANDLVHLPNNPYTPQQLFFINTAQAYCSHVGPVSYVLYLELGEHSPNPERIDGTMMNSRLFSEVFHCPVGSRMNPPEKCPIWTS